MLRIIQRGESMPASFAVDPSSEFDGGMVAGLTVMGNRVVATVSNGKAPIGIIDDIRTKAFTNVSWNEVVMAPAVGVEQNGRLVTPIDIKVELRKANVRKSSFTSDVPVVLNENNGIITFLAGTPLNFDLTGSGTPNAIRAVVSYTYYVANIPGDDTTAGSGRMSIWYGRMFAQTNCFETNVQYPINAPLFVSEVGLLTTRKPSQLHPSVAMVTAPPTPLNSMIEFFWF